MPEFIEMESTSSSSGGSGPCSTTGLVQKVLKHEYELRAFTTRSISHCWVILPILLYLVVMVGGIMTSISVGNIVAAYDEYCILDATLVLKDIDLSVNKTYTKEKNLGPLSRANDSECLFAEYASVACVMFGGIWIVMVLQCGRGGASKRGFRLPDAWRIVPPTCLFNFIYLIISCVVLAKISSGFAAFCNNIQFTPELPKGQNMSCMDCLVFSASLFGNDTDIVQEYNLSHVGATIQLVGCLLGFLIVTFRCCSGADFERYERRQIGYFRANTEDPGQSKEDVDDDDSSDSDSCKTPSATTTVIFHSPSNEIDDGEEYGFGSINSETGLISNPKSSMA